MRKNISEEKEFLDDILFELGNQIKEKREFALQRDMADKERKEILFRTAQYSAMLSDICQVLFGSNANGSPMILCHIHAGWICGAFPKPENITFLEWQYERFEKCPTKKDKEELEGWKEFISTLKSDFKKKN